MKCPNCGLHSVDEKQGCMNCFLTYSDILDIWAEKVNHTLTYKGWVFKVASRLGSTLVARHATHEGLTQEECSASIAVILNKKVKYDENTKIVTK